MNHEQTEELPNELAREYSAWLNGEAGGWVPVWEKKPPVTDESSASHSAGDQKTDE